MSYCSWCGFYAEEDTGICDECEKPLDGSLPENVDSIAEVDEEKGPALMETPSKATSNAGSAPVSESGGNPQTGVYPERDSELRSDTGLTLTANFVIIALAPTFIGASLWSVLYVNQSWFAVLTHVLLVGVYLVHLLREVSQSERQTLKQWATTTGRFWIIGSAVTLVTLGLSSPVLSGAYVLREWWK